MNESEPTLLYLNEPCPMCGSEWSLLSGQCQACGEVLQVIPDEDIDEFEENESLSKSIAHRILGVVILMMCGMVWHFLKIGSQTTNDPVWTVMRVVGLAAIVYCSFVGGYAVIAGRAPKYHRWQ